MRLFIGIPLDPTLTEQLRALSLRMQRVGDDLRWSKPESWHVTLQFLGKSSAEQLSCITGHLAAVRSAPLSMSLEGLGFFERAGVFHTSVRLTPELEQLQRKIVQATKLCDFEPEERPYNPHITLARSSRAGSAIRTLKARLVDPPAFASFIAHEFLLYESFPAPGGSRYEILERFSFVEHSIRKPRTK